MTGPARPPVSVVVPTRDRAELLADCLAALVAAVGDDDEVVVVDSASDDPAATAAVTEAVADPRVRLVRAEVPGASEARNRGWRAARHDLVVFVDDDIRPRPGWIDPLVAPLDAGAASEVQPTTRAVGFVTGRTVVPAAQAGIGRPVSVKEDVDVQLIDEDFRGAPGGSCNLAVPRAVLEQVGGFATDLGPGTWFAAAEDLDLYDRILATGRVGRYEPAAVVEHVQWRDRGSLLRLDWAYGKGAGARVARLWHRGHRQRARAVLREVAWDGGVRAMQQALRDRYRFGALTVGVRTVATLVGLAAGLVRFRR